MNGSEGSRTKDRCVPNLCYLWLHFDAQIFNDLALVRLLRYAGSAWIAYGLWFSSVQATTAPGQFEDNCFLDHVQIVCFFSLFNVSSSTRSLRRIFTDALAMVSYQNFYKKHELSTDQRLFNLIQTKRAQTTIDKLSFHGPGNLGKPLTPSSFIVIIII